MLVLESVFFLAVCRASISTNCLKLATEDGRLFVQQTGSTIPQRMPSPTGSLVQRDAAIRPSDAREVLSKHNRNHAPRFLPPGRDVLCW